MTKKKASERRVVMAKKVACRWLESKVKDEHRLTVYAGGPHCIKNLPNLLRSFRDGKVAMGGVDPIPDLGIEEKFDSICVWSSDRTALITFKDWCEQRGLETSGLW